MRIRLLRDIHAPNGSPPEAPRAPLLRKGEERDAEVTRADEARLGLEHAPVTVVMSGVPCVPLLSREWEMVAGEGVTLGLKASARA